MARCSLPARLAQLEAQTLASKTRLEKEAEDEDTPRKILASPAPPSTRRRTSARMRSALAEEAATLADAPVYDPPAAVSDAH